MTKTSLESHILRVVSIAMMSAFLIFFAFSFAKAVSQLQGVTKKNLVNAQVSLNDVNFNDGEPVSLNGEWDVFPGVYLEQYNANALRKPERFVLPTESITQIKGAATYRAMLDIPHDVSTLAIFIPNFRSAIQIYVNGIPQNIVSQNNSYGISDLSGEKVFVIKLKPATSNELVFSVGKNSNENPLFKRGILIGAPDTLYGFASSWMANAVFIFGLFILLTISAFLFVFLYPQHREISLITLLDSFIVFSAFFGLGDIVYFAGSILGGFYLSDSMRLSMQIACLMLAGVFGAILAVQLYDPEQRTPQWLTRPLPWLYLTGAIVFAIKLDWAETFGIYVMLGIFLYTSVALLFQLTYYWRKNRNAYALFQIIKTGYFGSVVFLNILFLNTTASMMYFAYAYMLFLMMHLFIRLYDNKMIYTEVEKLNITLEHKVEERTSELLSLNKMLSEISIRDALTNAYNRLHFERSMEAKMASFDPRQDVMHLCMFDLDHFKNINDTYGHAAGDEQLKYIVRTINKMIDGDTLLARVGGEEFVLVFFKHDTDEVMATLERIRQTFEAQAKAHPDHTTASFGVVRYQAGMTQKQWLQQADQCLYTAKHNGRNRIVSASDMTAASVALA